MTASIGPAAGVHTPWAAVPGAVRQWAARIGGGVPRSTRDVPGGLSPGATTVLHFPRSRVFVKAVSGTAHADSALLHRREGVVSAALPLGPELPRLLEVYDDGDWVALAFEAVDGRPPRYPWEERELRAAVRALDALHDSLTPNPVAGVEPAVIRLARLFGGWTELAAMTRPPVGLDEWCGRNLDRLATLESGWRAAVTGLTLLHCDVRADNLLVTKGGVVFVDWPHACVGVPVFDLVAWAPSVQLEGGPGPEDLLAMSVPSSVVEHDTLVVLVAAVAGFLVARSLRPSPPGLPTLRALQAAQGAVALSWLQRLTGW